MHPAARERLFGFQRAFDHSVTLWVTVALVVVLAVTPLIFLILAKTGPACTSIHPANHQFSIGIRTGQSGGAGATCDNPGDSVVFRQTIEVFALKVLPSALRFDLLLPVFRQLREQRHGAAVFDVIGQRSARQSRESRVRRRRAALRKIRRI